MVLFCHTRNEEHDVENAEGYIAQPKRPHDDVKHEPPVLASSQVVLFTSSVLLQMLHSYEGVRQGPHSYGSRNYKEINMQNENCQMGGSEVAGR